MIYVASSWRNHLQPVLVHILQSAGLQVYDFRNPPGRAGFGWEQAALSIEGNTHCPQEDYLRALKHPRAIEGFETDYTAMLGADTFVLVLPCGRSAHLELGWAVGQGKKTCVLLDDPCTPELMYKMVDHLAPDVMDLLAWLGVKD